MEAGKVGALIARLRGELNMTQKELAARIGVSDKAVSKWECGQGCPDISLLSTLSSVFKVNIEQLLTGELTDNAFTGGNMKKTRYFVCQNCGSLTLAAGNQEVSCCGKKLTELTPEKADEAHALNISLIDGQWFAESPHPMTKEHYVSFIAFACGERIEVVKQYPEWNLQTYLSHRHGMVLWYCTVHGLFYMNI